MSDYNYNYIFDNDAVMLRWLDVAQYPIYPNVNVNLDRVEVDNDCPINMWARCLIPRFDYKLGKVGYARIPMCSIYT